MQYIKINQVIAEQIEQGMLESGQKLPSERKLAESFDTTRVTLREALSLLEADGLIYREDRRGWFISHPRLRVNLNSKQSFVTLANDQQRQPRAETVEQKSLMANKLATQLLQLAPFSEVLQLDQLFYLEQRPVCYSTCYINREHFSDLFQHSLEHGILECCEQHYGVEVVNIHHEITTCALLGDICQQLHATPGTPALVITRRFYNSQDQVLFAEVAYWRHNTLQLEATNRF
ncbi:UTRA domain-containing protein [Vibrio sp. RC27]